MPVDTDQQQRLVAQLDVFKDRLLDINTRNPSLLLRREVQARSFDLSKLGAKAVQDIYGRMVRGSAGILLVADTDESTAAVKNRRHLQQLMRAATERAEESGLQELYVGLCWLTGHIEPRTFLRGPLLLVPAKLEQVKAKRGAGWQLHLEPSELAVNEAIAAVVRKLRGVRFIDELTAKVRDTIEGLQAASSNAQDVQSSLFAVVTQELSNTALRLSAAQSTEGALPLQPITVADTREKSIPLAITCELIVGLFPQSSTALYADMESLVEKAQAGEVNLGIIDNLLEAAADPAGEAEQAAEHLDNVSEASVHPVVQIDPSQLSVLKLAQKAECVVVRGPPGTGKSQLIVNLVSDAMARDKRVLVVCQKRAALDVVYRRLNSVGLSGAAALVHDASADRAELYKKLSATLQGSTTPAARPRDTAAALAASADREAQSLRSLVAPLGEMWRGLPLFDLYSRANARFAPLLEIKGVLLDSNVAEIERICAGIEQAKHGRLRFDREPYPLALRTNWSGLGHVDAGQLQSAFAELGRRLTERQSLITLPDPDAGVSLGEQLSLYLTLRSRWYRWLLPRWWRARDAIQKASAWFAGASVDAWKDALDHYLGVVGVLRNVGSHMRATWLSGNLKALSQPSALVQAAAHAHDALRSDLNDIRAHDRVLASLPGEALAVLDQCVAKLPHDLDWGQRVKQEVLLRWIDEAEARHPQLRDRIAPAYQSTRERLHTSIEQRRTATAHELATRLRSLATTPTLDPAQKAHANRKAATDWNKLGDELAKKRRIKPLRTLLSEFAWPMKQAIRCWLASPEVVAEVFPLERNYFDLVIFDEASQLTVERALPVLYRGAQVVIAGDEQQMPPSNFFSSVLDEEDEPSDGEEQLGEARFADSLLSQAKRIYGFHYLAWHYRSRHQQLIEFSNHAFYDGMLQVAANIECGAAAPPIQWIPVSGVWSNQTNAIEATSAVDNIAQLLRERPGESVGVITFNQKQQELILDVIDQRRASDPEFDALYSQAENPTSGNVDDKPFVKNIENVQGDERDHIIFSIGYAKGPDGVLRRNFGPLGVTGGENRLNVAVTRARLGVRVICSFEPDALAVENAKNRGPLILKKYLQYAQAVSDADTVRTHGVLTDLNTKHRPTQQGGGAPSFDSPLEEQVYDALIERGLRLYTQWGAGGYHIDLVVVDPTNPDRLCLGIECDGARYHSGRSVRERDISRQAFLESRGWKIHRIWSRDWWQDPQAEVTRILEKLPTAKA